MTASVLSLTVMSGLKSFHKSRLQPKQRLTKKDEEKVWLSQQEQAACDPLSAGWLVLKQQDLVGEAYCDSWPASRSAGPDQTRFPDPRHMRGGVGSVGKGEGAPHGLACFSGTMKRNTSPLKNVACF